MTPKRTPQSSTPPQVQEVDLEDLPGFSPTTLTDSEPQPPTGEASTPDLSLEPEPDAKLDVAQLKTDRGSSRASTAEDREALVGAIAIVFAALTTLLHKRFAPKNTTLWIAHEDEVKDVSEPLGRIAARRNPLGAAGADVGDGIQAGVAAAAYAMRNISDAVYLASPAGQQEMNGGLPATFGDEAQQ